MLLYAECGLNADGPRNIANELNIINFGFTRSDLMLGFIFSNKPVLNLEYKNYAQIHSAKTHQR